MSIHPSGLGDSIASQDVLPHVSGDSSASQSQKCPCCGFAFGWDEKVCRHCNPSISQNFAANIWRFWKRNLGPFIPYVGLALVFLILKPAFFQKAKNSQATDAQKINSSFAMLNLHPWAEVGRKVQKNEKSDSKNFGATTLEYENTYRIGIATLQREIESNKSDWEATMGKLPETSEEVKTYRRLQQMTTENKELLTDFSNLQADLREWYYRFQAFAKRLNPDEVFVESLVRGYLGDPLGKYREIRAGEEHFQVEFQRLLDRETYLMNRKSELMEELKTNVRSK